MVEAHSSARFGKSHSFEAAIASSITVKSASTCLEHLRQDRRQIQKGDLAKSCDEQARVFQARNRSEFDPAQRRPPGFV